MELLDAVGSHFVEVAGELLAHVDDGVDAEAAEHGDVTSSRDRAEEDMLVNDVPLIPETDGAQRAIEDE